MSEMVERVAKAIAKAATPNLIETVLNRNGGLTEPIAKALAIAAIAALREPTEEMELAGEKMDDTRQGRASPVTHWQLMIDAALKD